MVLVCVLGRVFCLCPVFLFLIVHDVWMLWKLGGIDGDPVLRGMRIRATWEYVSSVEGGQLGMVDLCVICGCGESTCTIARSPPSTTYEGYPIILQA